MLPCYVTRAVYCELISNILASYFAANCFSFVMRSNLQRESATTEVNKHHGRVIRTSSREQAELSNMGESIIFSFLFQLLPPISGKSNCHFINFFWVKALSDFVTLQKRKNHLILIYKFSLEVKTPVHIIFLGRTHVCPCVHIVPCARPSNINGDKGPCNFMLSARSCYKTFARHECVWTCIILPLIFLTAICAELCQAQLNFKLAFHKHVAY